MYRKTVQADGGSGYGGGNYKPKATSKTPVGKATREADIYKPKKPTTTPVNKSTTSSSKKAGGSKSGGSGGYGYNYGNSIVATPAYSPTAPDLRGLALGNLYGINYDEEAIRSKFDEATRAEYAMRDKEHRMTENTFYNNLYGTQATALDTIRRNASQAIATGASRGMQAANELSAVLGLTQEGVMGSTELAQKRNLLKDEEAAAYTKNAMEALEMSNALRQQIGTLDSQNYASDIQHNVGEMDYYARLDQAMKQLQGMQMQAAAQRYAADRNVDAQQILADANLKTANIDATTRKELSTAQQTPGFNEMFEQAMSSGNDAAAIAHLMNYTNMSKKDAANVVKQAKAVKQPKTTSDYQYNYGGSNTVRGSALDIWTAKKLNGRINPIWGTK